MLAAAGIATDQSPRAIVADPRVVQVCDTLAAEVAERYRTLPGLFPVKYRKEMRSALIMQKAYGLIFDKLLARGWRERGHRPRLSKREGLATVLSTFAQ
jgi:hypothetical protein